MPASTAFQATYLDPPAGTVLNQHGRMAVGAALYGLVAKLREGYSAANAQAYVASVPRYTQALASAQAASGQANLTADFQAITTV